MIERKRRLIFIQLILLIFGLLILYNTYYYNKDSNPENEIISKATEEKIKTKNSENEIEEGDLFFNIEYTGLDLSGNRYLLKSEEAYLDELKPEVVYMKKVHAIFYFKDDTILYVWSDKGIYNNKTLDMTFEKNVRGFYEESILLAEKGEYLNSKNLLIITEEVLIKDFRGTMLADKLIFDIKKNTLDISSSENKKINANLTLNEKDF